MTKATNTPQPYTRPPRGYFKYVLALDSETTGLDWNDDDPSVGHQAVSWGFIVADAETLIPVEKLYVEIKWNDISRLAKEEDPEFGTKASDIHGLTFAHLEEHGIPEDEAVIKIMTLILKYWGPTNQIHAMGHNVQSFDIPFLKSMLRRYDIELRFSSRQLDTNAMGFITVGSFVSDALFDVMGYDDRDGHNALEDAEQALGSARRIRSLWNEFVGVNAYK